MATRLQPDEQPSSQFLNGVFQSALAHWNRRRLTPALPTSDWQRQLDEEHRMLRLEGGFLEEERAAIAVSAAAAPTDVDGFVAWFEALLHDGPGQGDALFPWLAETATVEDFRYYLAQEAAGEAGFEDLVALTQVKVPASAKMELANNYWDEMGRGNMKGMHGPMLDGVVEALDLEPRIEDTVWESLALANGMTAMATTRRYAFHSIGALGAIELTAPGRSRCVADGLKRLGFGKEVYRYFDLHAVLDVKHSADWNEKVIAPLVADNPACATAIAEGALIRLTAGARCFARYRATLWN